MNEEKELSLKSSLREFFKNNNELILVVQDAIVRMNRIVTETYHLINLHIRRLIEEKKVISNLTTE